MPGVRTLAVLLAASLSLSACDREPPRKVVLFVGDSLTTFPPSCAYPLQWRALQPAGVEAFNMGVFGSTARQWLETGRLQQYLALRRPTAVVIALGSNDARGRRPFGAIAGDLRALYDQVEATSDGQGGHPRAYVATVPPMYDPPDGKPLAAYHPPGGEPQDAAALQRKIAAVNRFIRLRFPADRVIDFDSWMPAAWSAEIMVRPQDGVHIGCGGHRLRAEHVAATVVP